MDRSAFLSGRFHRITDHIFTPVEASSTYEETLNRIGTAIRLGVLAPGERLPPERELAERMEISRSTLRQALGTLTESGHLVAIRGRSGGTFVADSPPVSIPVDASLFTRFHELVDYRTMLEIGIATLAAETASDQRIEDVAEVVAAQEAVEADDAVGYLRADAAFHLALARAPDNTRVERVVADLQSESINLMVVRIRATGLPPDLVQRSLDGHAGILAALQARAAQQAGHAMREHMRLFDAAMQRIGG